MREIVEKGPPSTWADDWFVFISNSSSLIVQSALEAHAVLTMEAPPLVAGLGDWNFS